MFIDTHSHLDLCMAEGIAGDTLVADMQAVDVRTIQISTEASGFTWSREFALRHNIPFTVGIHPSSDISRESLDALHLFLKDLRDTPAYTLLAGIGEIGLDYHWMTNPCDEQIAAFAEQINCAKTNNLPVLIHSRDAAEDTFDVLRNFSPPSGIMHCFSYDKAAAARALDAGLYISFAGNVTYKNAQPIQEAALYVPIDRLLIETDCPYLSPIPMRGKTNRPEHVIHTYRFIAQLREMGLDELEAAVEENCRRFFRGIFTA